MATFLLVDKASGDIVGNTFRGTSMAKRRQSRIQLAEIMADAQPRSESASPTGSAPGDVKFSQVLGSVPERVAGPAGAGGSHKGRPAKVKSSASFANFLLRQHPGDQGIGWGCVSSWGESPSLFFFFFSSVYANYALH